MPQKDDSSFPDPAGYGVSDTYGFLSSDAPATAFKDRYYKPWDDIIPQLSSLIGQGKLETSIGALPLRSIDRLHGEVEYRRAYIVLAFLVHGHVWYRNPPNQHVPPQLTEPFLGNWGVRNGGGMALENMETLASFNGSRGEAAFYHVPVLIEAEEGHLVHLPLDAIAQALEGRSQAVVEALRETTTALGRVAGHLAKFNGALKAGFFYHELRPFLAGGNGMEDKGLPEGMVFLKSDGSQMRLKLVGGSAAQSSLFPFLDIALGVEHEDRTVFDEMRVYMLGAHRDFLDAVSSLPSLRAFVDAQPGDAELVQAFDECLERLRSWRGRHIAIVSKYIVQPARNAEKVARIDKIETFGPAETDKEWELQGTGGSALIPFLRQARDDTVGTTK